MTRATGPAVRAPVRDPERPLLAGTRGSPLALIQTRDFLDRVRRVGTLLRRPQQGNPPVFARIRVQPNHPSLVEPLR